MQFGAAGGTLTNPTTVNNPLPVAVDDNATVNYVAAGGATTTAINNVLTNDLYNSTNVVPSQFTLTQVTAPSNSGVVLNTSTGKVTVAAGTPGGTYTLTYQISLNAAPANVDVATVTIKVLQADLGITKTVTPNTVVAGQNVSYTITVTNAGPTEAQAVSVADILSTNLTNVTTTPTVGTWVAPNWTIGTLASGTNATLTISAKVLASFSGVLPNSATVTSTTPDPNANNNTANANLTVTALTGPTAQPDVATVNVNTSVTNSVWSNDIKGSGNIVASSVALVSGTQTNPTLGTFTVNPTTGDITFAAGSNPGTSAITYRITDTNGLSSTSTLTVTIISGPTAVNDVASTSINSSVPIIVLSNDTKGSGDIVATSVALVSGSQTNPTLGTFAVNPTTGVVTFTANDAPGTSAITYRITDTNGLTSTATITVTILAGPTAVNDVASTSINSSVPIIVLGNDTKGSGDIVATSVVLVSGSQTNPTLGTFAVNPTTGVVTFTALGVAGTSTMSYKITDVNNLTSTATITVTILAGPTAVNDVASTSINSSVPIIVLSNDTKGSGDIVATSVTLVSGSQTNSTLGTFAVNPTTGVVTFTANAVAGSSAITYRITDVNNLTSTATITVTILAGPTAVNDVASTSINSSVPIIVLSNDTKGSGDIVATSVTLVSGSQTNSTLGTFAVNPTTGVVTFTALGVAGTSTMSYRITDVNNLTSTATITVTILAGPTAVNDVASTSINSSVPIIVLSNDTKGSGDIVATSVTLVSGSQTNSTLGTFAVNPTTGVVTFTANAVAGSSAITYRITDVNNLTSTATITVTILAGPTAVNDVATTNISTPVTITVTGNDIQGSGAINASTVTLVGTVPDPLTIGKFTVDNAGVVTFTPVTGYIGTTTIKYQVKDVNGLTSNEATITCTIINADLEVKKTAELSIVDGNQMITYTLTIKNNGPNDALAVSVSDPLPASVTYSGATNPTAGSWDPATYKWTITSLANGASATLKITYKVNTDFTGTVTNVAKITSTTGDPNPENNTSTVATPITALTGPVANNDAATTNINTPNTNITVLDNDKAGSSPINAATVTLGTQPSASEGSFTVNTSGVVTFTPATGFIGTTTIKYQVKDANGLISNEATITCTIIQADLDIKKTAVLSVVEGNQIVTYTIKVTNGGPDEAKAVVATDVLPTSLTITSVVPSTGTNWTAPTWTIGNLTNGASATLTIVAKVGAESNGTVTNTATVTSTTADPVHTNNTSTATSTTSTGPHAVDDNTTTTLNTAIPITVLTNDTKGSSDIVVTSVTLVSGTGPESTVGVFTVDQPTGVVTFTPANGYLGTASIKYQILDGNGISSQATITVTVTPSLINNFPATGFGTLAFEDLWPAKGDYDMNDLVLDYRFQITTNAINKVEKIVGTFMIKAFGASMENGFGFQLPGISNASDLAVTGYNLTDGYIQLNENGTEKNQAKPTIIVYDNAFKQMTSPGGTGVNTDPGQPYVMPKTLTITINVKPNTYSYTDLDISNFNPFLIVNKVRGVEVHLPDYAPTSLANPGLFGTVDDKSNPTLNKYYKTANNLPWAINFVESFDYPKEKIDIIQTYLHFGEWVTSGGTLFTDWYKNLTGYRNTGNIYQHP